MLSSRFINEVAPRTCMRTLKNPVKGRNYYIARWLGVNIPEVNKSGITWEKIITTSGYTYNKP
jgi:hypothetical protein